MVISFSYGVIIFQLTVWIGVIREKQSWTAKGDKDVLGFAYQSEPSRHEIPGETFHAVKSSFIY